MNYSCTINGITFMLMKKQVFLREPKKVYRTHRDFKRGSVKRRFYELVKEDILSRGLSSSFFDKVKSSYQIHHILPVFLGGGNVLTNLAMVEPDLHTKIHQYINEQTRGKETPATIFIPCHPEGKILWSGKASAPPLSRGFSSQLRI